MPYIPGCSADVFISYAHRDNLDGWVTRLKDKLTEKLNPFLAGRAEVWFDNRLKPGVYFKDEIQQKLNDTQIFIAVVSPSYLYSDYSITDELDWFQNRGGKEIIQFLKVPLDADQEVPLPDSQYQILYDPSDGHLLDGTALDKILDEVVAVITRKLRELWELRPKIYLAQVASEDVKKHWSELEQSLHAAGYALLPKGVLPARVPDNRIRDWLAAARLSVHPESTSDDSLAQRQSEIAKLVGHPTVTAPALLTKESIAHVVAEVQSKLEAVRKPAVYFIYDYYSDRERVAQLPDLIRQRTGYEVFLPEAGEAYHKFRLRVSDGVLLFRANAPEDWLKAQEQSLLQAAALSGRKAVEAKYFTRRANGQPASPIVRRGARQELVIERSGDPNIEDLKPFFDMLPLRTQAAGGAV
jgi:hypothetical protein